MNSGIYKLTFVNGDTYVGKSLHLERRWSQHWDKLSKGTAAANMMTAFHLSDYEYPTARVVLECHPDLLDEYENIFINDLVPSLNTQRPPPRSAEERAALVRHAKAGLATRSVPETLIAFETLAAEAVELEAQLEQITDNLQELETDYQELDAAWTDRALQELRKTQEYNQLVDYLDNLETERSELLEFQEAVNNSGWWKRLWRLW